MLLLVICPMFYSKGKVKFFIPLNNGNRQCIYDVYYMPRMKNNILSLGKLLDKDYENHLKDCMCLMRYCSNNVIANVPMAKNSLLIKHSS